MNKNIITAVFLFCALLLSASGFGQSSSEVEMADVLRSNGKIYVVVAVCLTILVGLFFYVMMLDRKIRRLEKHGKED